MSSDKSSEKKVDCSIEKKRGKYKLSCNPDTDIEGDIDGAIGKVDEDYLIINFKKGKDSSIDFKKIKPKINNKKKKKNIEITKEEAKSSNNKPLDEESSGIFSFQTIIYIIIGIIIILIIAITYIILCKSKKTFEDRQPDDASVDDIINNSNSH